MSFLGMAQHTDRFLRLLENANMTTVAQVEPLTKEQCDELQLPFDLVTALQRRLRVWKLEMVDDAEAGLDRGEEHYLKRHLERGVGLPNMVAEHLGGVGVDGELLEGMLQKTEGHILQAHDSKLGQALRLVQQELQVAVAETESRLREQIDTTTKTGDQRGEARAFETRLNSRLDELNTEASQREREGMAGLERRLTQAFEQHLALMATKVDLCCQKVEAVNQKIDVCSQKIDACHATESAQVSDLFAKLSVQVESGTEHAKQGFRTVVQRCETSEATLIREVVAAGSNPERAIADAFSAWRTTFEDFEREWSARRDEQRADDRSRFEDAMKNFAKISRGVEDVGERVQKNGDRAEASVQLASSNIQSEVQRSVANVLTKVESLYTSAARQQVDFETAVQGHFEEIKGASAALQGSQKVALETAFRTERAIESMDDGLQKHVQRTVEQATTACGLRAERAVEGVEKVLAQAVAQGSARAEKAVEGLESTLSRRLEQAISSAVSEGADRGAQQAASRAQKAVEMLDDIMQKRLDDAVSRASESSSMSSISHASRNTEKALEALESAQRKELENVVQNLSERLDDMAASMARKATEREDRNGRRIEEMLDMTTNRCTQKVEDVGLDLKKELHGFAKRLNSKIPFM